MGMSLLLLGLIPNGLGSSSRGRTYPSAYRPDRPEAAR